MAFVKVGILVLKQATKTLTKQLKTISEDDTIIRRTFLKYGQFHHEMTSRVQLRAMGHTVKKIKPLSEDKALVCSFYLHELCLSSLTLSLSLSLSLCCWKDISTLYVYVYIRN